MKDNIQIINNTNEEIKELVEIENFIDFAIKYLDIKDIVFNIIIVDNDTIWKLNREYRGIDRPTDVISFALEDNTDFVDIGFRVLGDIYISIDKANEQAINYGHSLIRELSFLSIHGLLHLLGYDHINKEDEEKMFSLQELILNEYGIKR